jgi:broad specificity phosphatase PhoE
MRVPIRPPAISFDPASPSPGRVPSLGTSVRVWLVRHADVHDDWQTKAYGNLDVPLSEEGVLQTRALAQAFARTPLARVASSPLSRALLLGRGLAEATSAPLAVDDRLREVWRGNWQGLGVDEFRARWEAEREAFAADPWNWKGHGGESDADIWARAWPALQETVLAADEASREGAHASRDPAQGGTASSDRRITVALATHYNVIRVLATRLSGLRPSQSYSFRNDTARASLIVDGRDGWVLSCANVAGPPSETDP